MWQLILHKSVYNYYVMPHYFIVSIALMVMYGKIVHFIREQNSKMLIHRNKKRSNNSRSQMKSNQIMATIVGLFVVTSNPITFYYIFIKSDSSDLVMVIMSKYVHSKCHF